jgi:nitrate/TMAO reductase-like tetraheme cytochrome c subunit
VPSRLAQLGSTIRARLSRLPQAVLIALAAVAVAVVAVSGVLLYRTYDYVQHDNNFCMSCHLMADPFDRFAQSAHRGLGCKACHQPTMAVRTQMALTQILENPDSIHTHAEVPNSACEGCHVTGDPEKWLQIASSAGHRIHLESEDPSLRGLKCVECHASSVHEFATSDKTCAQAGCHENVEVRLGRMGGFAIHCASCHDFNRPVQTSEPAETLAVALRPQREQCLSCHAMRTIMVDFPEDEPHNSACGACHNPHDQTTPAQAVESCATGGCHSQADTVTPFHRGLSPSVLSNCTSCHTAHSFATTTECMQCHQAIHQPGVVTAAPVSGRPTADSIRFQHSQHRNVECTACHETRETHGAVVITSFNECRSCHHTGQAAQTCTSCHQRAELTGQYRTPRPMRIADARTVTRPLPFDHRWHPNEACSSCHQPGLEQSAANVSCNSCHEQHHAPTTECRACHTRPSPTAHTAQAHLGCTSCHTRTQFQGGVPRTREFCMSCHQELQDHMPGRNCADCHALPAPRNASAGADPHVRSAAGDVTARAAQARAPMSAPAHRYAHSPTTRSP